MENAVKPAYKITDDMLQAAARIDDLDEACRSVQDAVGIDDGGVAGMHFGGQYEDDWPTADYWYRLQMLREWVDLEKVYADSAVTL